MENYIAEAQLDVRPRLNSWLDAAASPGIIIKRWKRHWRAEGDYSHGLTMAVSRCPLAALAGCLVFLPMFTMQWAIGINALFAGIIAFLFSLIGVWAAMAWSMFTAAYATMHVSFNPDPLRPWQTDQLLRAKVPRLAFKGRQDEVFHGSYAKGDIRLEIADGRDISSATSIFDFYFAAACRRLLQEGPLADGYSRIKAIERNGFDIHNSRDKKLFDHLAENWGFIIGVLFVAIAGYCLLQMQDGEVLMRPDIEARQAEIIRLQPAPTPQPTPTIVSGP